MNISQFGNMMAGKGSGGRSVFAGGIPLAGPGQLKSTRDKMQRMEKAASQIEFFEQQKENLKNKEGGTLEEIARKLEMLHTYEDEIAAVKARYNNEQRQHIMDEAEELGRKIAEAAEKLEPKTEEERREEAKEEALDMEEGVLSEAVDELQDELEEQLKELTEDELEDLEKLNELQKEKLESAHMPGAPAADPEAARELLEKLKEYRAFDMRV